MFATLARSQLYTSIANIFIVRANTDLMWNMVKLTLVIKSQKLLSPILVLLLLFLNLFKGRVQKELLVINPL